MFSTMNNRSTAIFVCSCHPPEVFNAADFKEKVVHKNIISDEIRGADSCVMRTCCRPNPFTEQNAEFIQRE